MKKATFFAAAVILCFGLTACSTNNAQLNTKQNNLSENGKIEENVNTGDTRNNTESTKKNEDAECAEFTTHSLKISTVEDFERYFTTQSYNGSSSWTGQPTTSTITVTPKLRRGFVEYSGYVIMQADSGKYEKDKSILTDRRIQIDYWGSGKSILNSPTDQNEDKYDFNHVEFSPKTVDITLTYHDEGASGNPLLKYDSISITKYNYWYYFSVTIELRSVSEISYAENDKSQRNPIYTTYYYYDYTVKESSEMKGLYEYNAVSLTFNNGKTIVLGADGNAHYIEKERLKIAAEKPEIINVEGKIDFYPSARR